MRDLTQREQDAYDIVIRQIQLFRGEVINEMDVFNLVAAIDFLVERLIKDEVNES